MDKNGSVMKEEGKGQSMQREQGMSRSGVKKGSWFLDYREEWGE